MRNEEKKIGLTFSESINIDPLFSRPLQQVCVRNSFKIVLQKICHNCSQRSADFAFESSSHFSVKSSGSTKFKNFDRYLKEKREKLKI